MIILVVGTFVALSIARYPIGTRESFGAYGDQLSVVESSVHYAANADKYGSTVSVIGKIKNDSDVAWKDLYIEAQYFDANGVMVDTQGSEQYGLVVPAHGEVAFRVRGSADRAENEYASHKVYVRSARDARSPF
jgi:hypothetical protein